MAVPGLRSPAHHRRPAPAGDGRVELDGRAAHPAELRWRDAARDNAAAVAGDTVLRYGWADTTARACETAAQLAAVLRANGWPAHPRPCGPHCRVVHP